jgi:hypothetical protein
MLKFATISASLGSWDESRWGSRTQGDHDSREVLRLDDNGGHCCGHCHFGVHRGDISSGPSGFRAQDNRRLARLVDERQVPGKDQVKKQLNVGFASISIFALKNLLFPTKNYTDMQDIAAPGDVLLLGNFKKDS